MPERELHKPLSQALTGGAAVRWHPLAIEFEAAELRNRRNNVRTKRRHLVSTVKKQCDVAKNFVGYREVTRIYCT